MIRRGDEEERSGQDCRWRGQKLERDNSCYTLQKQSERGTGKGAGEQYDDGDGVGMDM